MDDTEVIGLYLSHRIALMALSLLLLFTVLELMRRGLLKERYALLWLATAGASTLVGLFPSLVIRASALLHFQYLTLLVVITFTFTLALVLAFSVILSRLSERNRILAQEVAILSETVKRLEDRSDG